MTIAQFFNSFVIVYLLWLTFFKINFFFYFLRPADKRLIGRFKDKPLGATQF